MRHYILKQYEISHNTYMSVYYLIRSYKEIKQRMEDVLYASPKPPDGQPKGSVLSDPTYSKAAVRCVLDSQLKAIEQTAHEMAEKYMKTYTGEPFDALEAFLDFGVFSYYRAKKGREIGPRRETWTRYRNEFCYKVAKRLNYF